MWCRCNQAQKFDKDENSLKPLISKMTSKVDFPSFEKISYYISKNQAKLKNVLRTNPEIRFINICY